jgi:hypothetical protein
MDRRDNTPWTTYLCGICGCLFITGGLIWLIVLTVEFNHLHHALEEQGVIGDAIVAGAGVAAAGAAAGASLAAAAVADGQQQPAAQKVQLSGAGALKPNSNAFNYLSGAKPAKAADPAARWARAKKQK